MIGLESGAGGHFLGQSEVKPTPIVIHSHTPFPPFEPAACIFLSSFDWFTRLFVPFVIGQSDFNGLGFNPKIALFATKPWGAMLRYHKTGLIRKTH